MVLDSSIEVVQVFGYMSFATQELARGACLAYANPDVSLLDAGWCSPWRDFVPELGWNTSEPLWILKPEPRAISRRLEELCRMDALALMQIGRNLGTTSNDLRLRRAMQRLGLSEQQLETHLSQQDAALHKMRWLEVLDHLLGLTDGEMVDTQRLYDKVCMLGNTVSDQRWRDWNKMHAWQTENNQQAELSPGREWKVDLVSPDTQGRVIACSNDNHHTAIFIDAVGESGLQHPDPRNCLAVCYSSFAQMLKGIEAFLGEHGSGHDLGAQIKSTDCRNRYQGQAVVAHLLSLGAPRMRFGLREWDYWQHDLDLHGRQGVILPNAAFMSPGRRLTKAPPLQTQDISRVRCQTMPGGLMRLDLPGFEARASSLPASLRLYQPLSPYASGRQSIKPRYLP